MEHGTCESWYVCPLLRTLMFSPSLTSDDLVHGVNRDAVLLAQGDLCDTACSVSPPHLIDLVPRHDGLGMTLSAGEGTSVEIVGGSGIPSKMSWQEAAESPSATGVTAFQTRWAGSVVPLAYDLVNTTVTDLGVSAGVLCIGPRRRTTCRSGGKHRQQVVHRYTCSGASCVAHQNQVWHTPYPGR